MSYIALQSDKVISLCRAYMAYTEIMRDINQLHIIRNVSRKKSFVIFGKQIGYEKAFKDITKDSLAVTYIPYWVWNCLGDRYGDCENLILLANNNEYVNIFDNHSFILDSRWADNLKDWGIKY